MIAGDQVRVTVVVAVSSKDAFEVFTNEIELWWGKGPCYRVGARVPGVLAFERGVGGRLLERIELPGGPQLIELVTITVWEPGRCLVFEWHGVTFLPGEKTEVEVTFTEVEGGTNVVVCHRGWSTLPADQPARHGAPADVFVRAVGSWWADLLSSLREHVAR